MGAYNWILIDGDCPACSSRTLIRCQTRIASDYGGIGGRFHDREYALGEEMAWWPRDDARWPEWQQCTARLTDDPEMDEEDCYSTCTSCGASLVVHVRFHFNRPIAVLSISRDVDSPAT